MKVFSKFLAVLFIFCFICSTCFAEEEVGDVRPGSVPVETASEGAETEEVSGNKDIYINDYDDYINVVGNDEVSDAISDEEINNELKNYYEEYQNYLREYYDSYERTETYRAKVTEAEDSKEEYQVNYQDYSISKYVVQKIKAVVIEGNYSGEELSLDYVLTADTLNNIILSEVKKGDIIFVAINENEDGSVVGQIANSWATVERINKVFIIGLIIAIILIIYGGKKGFSVSLIAVLSFIFATIIIPNFAFDGNGIVVVGILEILCLIFTICAVHIGVNRNSFKAMVISTIMTAASFGLIVFLNNLLRISGVTFEHAAIAENVILGNINFTHLYYITTLIIASAFISNATAMAVKKIDRESASDYEEKVINARNVLPSNITLLFTTALTLYIPNHILLLTNKFGEREIFNSETLLSEIIRLLVITLCITLIVPIVSLDKFRFGKKYLKPAEETSKENTSEKPEEK